MEYYEELCGTRPHKDPYAGTSNLFYQRALCACFIFTVFYIYRIFIYILSMFLAKMFLKSSCVVFTRVHCIERFPSQRTLTMFVGVVALRYQHLTAQLEKTRHFQ